MVLTLPRQGSIVEYRGIRWRVDGWLSGNRLALTDLTNQPPAFLSQPVAGYNTEVVNVGHCTVIHEEPVPVDPFRSGTLRLLNDRGELVTHLRAGIQSRAHLGSDGLRDLPTMEVLCPGGAIGVLETEAGTPGAHHSGTTILHENNRRGRHWLLRPNYGGSYGLVIESVNGMVAAIAQPVLVDGIEKPIIRTSAAAPYAVGDVVTVTVDPLVGHGTTGTLETLIGISMSDDVFEWRPCTQGDRIALERAGVFKVHVVATGTLTDGCLTQSFADFEAVVQ